MTLSEIRAAVLLKIEDSNSLPQKVYLDGEEFDPRGPGSWMRVEIVGGTTQRLGMTPEGTVERRPLAVIEIGTPFGKGDAALTAYEDEVYRLFPSALAVMGDLRVRANGVFLNARYRRDQFLVSSTTVPLEVRYEGAAV